MFNLSKFPTLWRSNSFQWPNVSDTSSGKEIQVVFLPPHFNGDKSFPIPSCHPREVGSGSAPNTGTFSHSWCCCSPHASLRARTEGWLLETVPWLLRRGEATSPAWQSGERAVGVMQGWGHSVSAPPQCGAQRGVPRSAWCPCRD